MHLGTAGEEKMDEEEGACSSSRSPAAAGRVDSSTGGSHEYFDIEKEIFDRLLEKGIPEVVADPLFFRERLRRHFQRLPLSYAIEVDVGKAEDVLLHRRILAECADPDKRPVFHVRLLHCIRAVLEDYSEDNPWGSGSLTASTSRDVGSLHVHEIIFSTLDKPKVLAHLSALLSGFGLNIREAHVFSTSDGFCLHIFIVDGWDTEETESLLQCLKEAAVRNHERTGIH